MNSKLYQHLYALTPTEELQKKSNKFCSDFNEKTLINSHNLIQDQLPIFSDEFFKNSPIYVSKHSRFADYPKHTHTFLEINYMLSGQAVEIVNGERIILYQGDLLLLDVGTTHSIQALGQNDLLINIIFRNDAEFSLDNLRTLSSKHDFIFQTLFKDKEFSRYLIYREESTDAQIRTVLDQIIEEYFSLQTFSNYLLNSYLNSLLILLARNTDVASSRPLQRRISKPVLLMLKEISNNYQNISLHLLAKKANYNSTYLGNLFKRETGVTFSAALTEQRLLQAYNLLTTSHLSTTKIMEKIGLSNRSFFYRKFEEKFNTTPNKLRQEKRQS